MAPKLVNVRTKRGAPEKKKEQKVLPNGLLPGQWKRLQEEAERRGVSAAYFHRVGVDWFISALDASQDNHELPKLPKEVMEKF